MAMTEAQSGSDAAGKLGRRLRELRKSKGMSQRELADRARLFRSNVSRAELGTADTTVDVILRLARAIGAQPSEVFSVLDEVGRGE